MIEIIRVEKHEIHIPFTTVGGLGKEKTIVLKFDDKEEAEYVHTLLIDGARWRERK